MLRMASRINGINKLVVNKTDILEEVGTWRAYSGPNVLHFDSKEDMEFWIETKMKLEVSEDIETFFSGDKESI
jgi:adenylosuccinate synthase